jgi:hypothetical protein
MGWTEKTINKSTPTGVYIRTEIAVLFKGIADIAKFEEGQEVGGVQAFYVAFRNPESTLGGVVITQREGDTLQYKVISENEQPVYYGASPEFINSLSPTQNSYAIKWREKCLGNEAHKAKVQQAIQKLDV